MYILITTIDRHTRTERERKRDSGKDWQTENEILSERGYYAGNDVYFLL